jgi:predicted Zn-dependent protease
VRVWIFLAVLALAAAPVSAGESNRYDKFRNETYSNDGLMSERDEIRLGAEVHRQVLQKYRLVTDPAITAPVQELGQRLARTSGRPNLAYTFYVIDDSSVNAFSLPGGFIYMNTGLLALAQAEDELASALAHEIAHVVARHGLRNYKKAQRTALLFGILGAGAEVATRGSLGGRAIGAASQLLAAGIITRFGRDFEREADYLGLHNIVHAGYEAEGMVRMFGRLAQAHNGKKTPGGGIFASHPDAKERIHNTQVEIAQHLNGTVAGVSGRPRRVGGTPGNSGGFDRMKAGVSTHRSSTATNPGTNQPERPVLRRRP